MPCYVNYCATSSSASTIVFTVYCPSHAGRYHILLFGRSSFYANRFLESLLVSSAVFGVLRLQNSFW